MLDGRLMVQWRRNSNNSMDKTPWTAFMESKDKFHNFELAALLKSKAAPTARSPRASGAKKPGHEGRGSGWSHQASGVRSRLPCLINISRQPEPGRAPLASALPTPDLIG
jgi:hypothetical protein